MEFLGVGPMELLLILIVALIFLGPKDMVKAGKTLGKFLRSIVMSPVWQAVQQTSRDLRYLPNRLMREAGLEEEAEELKKIGQQVDELSKSRASIAGDIENARREINRDLSAWTTPPTIDSPPPPALEPAEAPPAAEQAGPPPAPEPPEPPAAPEQPGTSSSTEDTPSQ